MGLWNYCEVCGEKIETGQPCIGVKEKSENMCGDSICSNCAKSENMPDGKDAVSIADLLARAEAAEIRCKTLEKMVKEYQETIIPGYRQRAETAEEIASDLCDDFTDFVTGGIHNAAPYCANRRPECVNAHGWCDGDNRVCRGFVPKAAARNKDGGSDVPLSQQDQAADPQR